MADDAPPPFDPNAATTAANDAPPPPFDASKPFDAAAEAPPPFDPKAAFKDVSGSGSPLADTWKDLKGAWSKATTPPSKEEQDAYYHEMSQAPWYDVRPQLKHALANPQVAAVGKTLAAPTEVAAGYLGKGYDALAPQFTPAQKQQMEAAGVHLPEGKEVMEKALSAVRPVGSPAIIGPTAPRPPALAIGTWKPNPAFERPAGSPELTYAKREPSPTEPYAGQFGVTESEGERTGDLAKIQAEQRAARDSAAPGHARAQEFFGQQRPAQIEAAKTDLAQNLAPNKVELGETSGVAADLVQSQLAQETQAQQAAVAQGGQRLEAAGQTFKAALSPTRTVLAETPYEAADMLSNAVANEAEKIQAAKNAAYEAANALPGKFHPASFNTLTKELTAAVRSGADPILINPQRTPVTSAALSDLDDMLSGLKQFRDPETGRVLPRPPITPQTVDLTRQRLNSWMGQARQSAYTDPKGWMDVNAMRRVVDAFDDAVAQRFSRGQFLGGDATAVNDAFNNARQLNTQYRKTFFPQGSGDVVGSDIQKILGKFEGQAATPEQVQSILYGSANAPKIAQRLLKMFGNDSPEIGAVRQGLYSYMTGEPGKAALAPEKAADRILSFLDGKQRTLTQTYFNPQQVSALRNYAEALKQHAARLNPVPNSAEELASTLVGPRATPTSRDEVVRRLFAGGTRGDSAVLNLVKDLKGRWGADSPYFTALRQGMFRYAAENAEGLPEWGPAKMATQLSKMLNSQVASELYTPAELQTFRAFADLNRRLAVPQAGANWSNTGPQVSAAVRQAGAEISTGLGALIGHALLGGYGALAGATVTPIKNAVTAMREAKQIAKQLPIVAEQWATYNKAMANYARKMSPGSTKVAAVAASNLTNTLTQVGVRIGQAARTSLPGLSPADQRPEERDNGSTPGRGSGGAVKRASGGPNATAGPSDDDPPPDSPASAPVPAGSDDTLALGNWSDYTGPSGVPRIPMGNTSKPDGEDVPGVGFVPNEAPKAVNRLIGANGEERYQTWPERMVRSGASLAHDVMTGEEPVTTLRREDVTDEPPPGAGTPANQREGGFWPFNKLAPVAADPRDRLIERSMDMAGLAGGASLPMAEEGAVGMAGGKLRPAMRLGDKVYSEAQGPLHVDVKAPQRVWNNKNTEFGFVDADDNFLPRGAALEVAHDQGLLKKSEYGSEHRDGGLDAKSLKYGQQLLSDTQKPGAALAALHNQPPLYSAVERAIANAPQNKMQPEQWVGWLKNQPGVKAEELNWVGLGDDPRMLPPDWKGAVSKDQLLQHVKENGVLIEDVEHGLQDFDQLAVEALPKYKDDFFYREGRMPDKHETEALLEQARNDIREDPPEMKYATQYDEYQMPGGTNYQELLLTLPKLEPEYMTSHWPDEPNVLAHVRMNDRDIPGVGKSLHLEELQSDLHQRGRKEGYRQSVSNAESAELENLRAQRQTMLGGDLPQVQSLPADFTLRADPAGGYFVDAPQFTPFAWGATSEEAVSQAIHHLQHYQLSEALEPLNTRIEELEHQIGAGQSVPDAPFKQSWPDLGLRRAIVKAARENYDAVSWTPGEQQAARYDLSKHVDRLELTHNRDGIGELEMWPKGGSVRKIPIRSKEELANTVGKDLAEKLYKQGAENNGKASLRDLDLKVGGEGMKAFYDKMLVDKANAIGKKFGAKVEWKSLEPHQTAPISTKPFAELTKTEEAQLTQEFRRTFGDSPTRRDLRQWYEEYYADPLRETVEGIKVPVLRLTPGLKEAAQKGLPLFSDTQKPGVALSAAESHRTDPKLLSDWQGGTKDMPDASKKVTEIGARVKPTTYGMWEVVDAKGELLSYVPTKEYKGGQEVPVTAEEALAKAFSPEAIERREYDQKRSAREDRAFRAAERKLKPLHPLTAKEKSMLTDWKSDGIADHPVEYPLSTLKESAEFGAALSKFPEHKGTIFRGTALPSRVVEGLKPGGLYTFSAHSSAATDQVFARAYAVPEKPGEIPVLLELKQKSGREIPKDYNPPGIDDGREIVVLKGTKYRVTSVKQGKSPLRIRLEEVGPSERGSGGTMPPPKAHTQQQPVPRPPADQPDTHKPGEPQAFAAGGRVDPTQIDANPTQAQAQAGNYRKEHINILGLSITIENAKGSKRRGIGKDGKPWATTLPANYGYIKRSEGMDQDHVDCYVGPHLKSQHVFVIDQVDADTKAPDEHKCMLGFGTKQQAINTYIKGFSDGKGKARVGNVTSLSVEDFKRWLKDGDTTEPLAPTRPDGKIHRDAFVYLPAAQNNKQCSSCCLYDGKLCTIMGLAVEPGWSCALYVPGEYNGSKPEKNVTPAQAGLTRTQVRCENCRYGGNTCALYERLNKTMPDKFDLDTAIQPKACCNAWVSSAAKP